MDAVHTHSTSIEKVIKQKIYFFSEKGERDDYFIFMLSDIYRPKTVLFLFLLLLILTLSQKEETFYFVFISTQIEKKFYDYFLLS